MLCLNKLQGNKSWIMHVASLSSKVSSSTIRDTVQTTMKKERIKQLTNLKQQKNCIYSISKTDFASIAPIGDTSP